MAELSDDALEIIAAAKVATLSSLSKDQSIMSCLVWFEYQDDRFLINTTRGSAKQLTISRSGKATVLVSDPQNHDRYVCLRCELERITVDTDCQQLDRLTFKNMGLQRWYGDVEEADHPEQHARITMALKPVRVFEALL